uniref:Uncharacterized protein n=1 Tax=Toxoplasma gondii TgCATBr9 TaxID=943120 RepID=A0A2T6IZP8_TOXGO|nr:hypothetical protein TGBR9_357060 [Toxoplasma gondii TgCATBr9]
MASAPWSTEIEEEDARRTTDTQQGREKKQKASKERGMESNTMREKREEGCRGVSRWNRRSEKGVGNAFLCQELPVAETEPSGCLGSTDREASRRGAQQGGARRDCVSRASASAPHMRRGLHEGDEATRCWVSSLADAERERTRPADVARSTSRKTARGNWRQSSRRETGIATAGVSEECEQGPSEEIEETENKEREGKGAGEREQERERDGDQEEHTRVRKKKSEQRQENGRGTSQLR